MGVKLAKLVAFAFEAHPTPIEHSFPHFSRPIFSASNWVQVVLRGPVYGAEVSGWSVYTQGEIEGRQLRGECTDICVLGASGSPSAVGSVSSHVVLLDPQLAARRGEGRQLAPHCSTTQPGWLGKAWLCRRPLLSVLYSH